ncbi:DUF6221 family protein [Nonomuraea wenchangensis]|uniref:Uncharacterized protein n=1 Tax=Nonomuraea wenchangensis TaxID=568860 RepID=A0A1I0EWU4_9ACTN|nr:DUF6221 family protein [Nonomuraea wenchangensis]SET49974.1 hypothetical protein SAMN05421811_103236 [Nonomuraea wenchangensis]
MTSDMLSWTRQQIEHRKSLAEEAHGASWEVRGRLSERPDGGADDLVAVVDAEDGTELFGVALPSPGVDEDDLAHIAFNDPQQIITDCQADLAILDDHEGSHECAGVDDNCMWILDGDCPTVRRIASRYRHRPGYLPEWAPERTDRCPS